MCSKRASDPQRLWEIVKRKILPGLFISVSIAALSPFVLGYALYRMLVGWGVVFVPQNAFFLIGLVTSFSLAWGLSFVRSVARFYNGTCTCQSERGKGSTFTVTLPLVDAAACRV